MLCSRPLPGREFPTSASSVRHWRTRYNGNAPETDRICVVMRLNLPISAGSIALLRGVQGILSLRVASGMIGELFEIASVRHLIIFFRGQCPAAHRIRDASLLRRPLCLAPPVILNGAFFCEVKNLNVTAHYGDLRAYSVRCDPAISVALQLCDRTPFNTTRTAPP